MSLLNKTNEPKREEEKVNHPEHYQGSGLEVIDVIEAFGLDFQLGNAVKYILRAGRKGTAREDIQKAAWYLNRWLGNDGKNEGRGVI